MRATGLRTHVWNNALKTAALLAVFPILSAVALQTCLWVYVTVAGGIPLNVGARSTGDLFGHVAYTTWHQALALFPSALPWGIAAVLGWAAAVTFWNVAMVSAMTGAHTVSRAEEPELYNVLENLCISRGMRMPKLRIMETAALNAYASGLSRSQYTVAVTRGLMETLDRDELEAVLAHELAHIKHGDVRLMVVAGVFTGIFSVLTDLAWRGVWSRPSSGSSDGKKNGNGAVIVFIVALAVMAVLKLLSVITNLAISRSREFMADSEAVLMTGKPDAMVGALSKISGRSAMPDVPGEVRGMMIDHPVGFFGAMFATHPPITERIRRLVLLGGASMPSQEAPRRRRTRGPWDT